MSKWNPERVAEALRFVAEAHNEQPFPGTDLPYLLHLSQVTTELMAALAIEPEPEADLAVMCAVLHDVVEDTEITGADVAARFGDEVAAGVAALTKDTNLPKAEQMADSLRRIRMQPRAVWKVKLADRVTNLQEPPSHWSSDKRARYEAQALEILDALGEASPVLSGRMRSRLQAR